MATFKVGDRVVLVGLTKAAHLNGRHGHIGSLRPAVGRYAVNLDLVDPSTPMPAVKASNLQPEATTRCIQEPQAGVSRGCIEEKYGRALCMILDAIRFISATEFMQASDVNGVEDIEAMRWSDDCEQQARLNQFLAMAWSHWTDPGTFHTPDNMSVFEMTRMWAQEQMKNQILPETCPPEAREWIDIISDAFDHQTAAKSWHVRIHGEFWVVGSDDAGTFLIPKVNQDTVYQCVGLTSNLHDLVRRYGEDPLLCTLTLIPFYGRLVYDGTVTPVNALPGVMMFAQGRGATSLRTKVEEAKKQGRVIQRLRQLEVEGGSLEGLPTQGKIEIDRSSDQKDQPLPTAEEAKLVEKLKKVKAIAEGEENGIWVFRRFGYTEQENPHHMGFILCSGTVLGEFHCKKGLAPTAMDILKPTVKLATKLRRRPNLLMPDDHACYQRVKFLLQDVAGTRVDYYHPPTPEETAAHTSGPPPY